MTLYMKYQPVEGKFLKCRLPQKMMSALGSLPREMDSEDIMFLSGIAAGEPQLDGTCNEIIRAIHTYGTIRVWSE